MYCRDVEDSKEAEELLEEKNEGESVKEIMQEVTEELMEDDFNRQVRKKVSKKPSQIELLEAETMSNQGAYYRDIFCMEICFLFCVLAVFSVGYIYEFF